MAVKSNEDRGDVDEPWLAMTEDFSVSAVWIICRIVHDSSCNRVEMDIGNDLPKLIL